LFYLNHQEGSILSAGDETKLKNITFLRVCDTNKAILVYQKLETKNLVSIFDRDRIGNASPTKHLEFNSNDEISNIQISNYRKEIILTSKINKFVRFINSEADSRYLSLNSKFAIKVLRQIQGPTSELKAPLAAIHSPLKKQIYVLDRIKTFTKPKSV
jgi:hypothetical protein